ncbi:MAG: hypothetical protein KDA57_24435 [Planctomycetales bacterium]|nr:hypothetical protein [Planctomycetales bacterium]
MSDDTMLLSALDMVASIRRAFPGESALIDDRLQHHGFSAEESPYRWVEEFSQLTTEAIEAREYSTAQGYLQFMSRALEGASTPTANCIDVYYVEALMWSTKDDRTLRAGWGIVPVNLRNLYVEMWGERPFMGSS